MHPAPRPSVPDRQEAILAALRLCPLYFILDESLLLLHEPRELARTVVHAGVRLLQLRVKQMPPQERLRLALEVRKITLQYGCLFIVNDELDLAFECRADGVHLGEDDLPIAAARESAPQLIIGATARTPESAWEAEVAGADYIGCGSVFASATKPGLALVGVEGLAAVNRYVSIPVVGIGGITLANCHEVLATGVAGICAVEPFRYGDPAGVVSQFICARAGVE